MSMKAMLLAAATAATLLVPAIASARDWGHYRSYDRRDDRRVETSRWYGHDRRDYERRGYGYGAYPTYRYQQTYRSAAPVWRDRDRRWNRDRRWDQDRDYGRRY